MTSSLGFCKWVAFLLLVSSNLQHSVTGVQEKSSRTPFITGQTGLKTGVLYGLNGNNLPKPYDVIAKLRHYDIRNIRLSYPDPEVLRAIDDYNTETKLEGLSIFVGVPNENLPSMALVDTAADTWVKTYMDPYPNIFVYFVTVGDEAIPGPYAKYVAPAMRNMRAAVEANGYGYVGVSTVVGTQVLNMTLPFASSAVFLDPILGDMVEVLKAIHSEDVLPEFQKLMINIFPFKENLKDNLVSPAQMLNFTLFKVPPPGVMDGELAYQSMFDTLVDSFYWAMEKAGFDSIYVAVGETGWPWAGHGNLTTTDLASTYNGAVKNKIEQELGTPKRPADLIETFIKSIFDENKNADGYSQYYGLWNTDFTPKYPLF